MYMITHDEKDLLYVLNTLKYFKYRLGLTKVLVF